jgi:hypothetical protein
MAHEGMKSSDGRGITGLGWLRQTLYLNTFKARL